MAAGYLHVEIDARQLSRHAGAPCGDVVQVERTATETMLVLCDGLGHGIRARVAAQLHVARLTELRRQDYPLRKAFAAVVKTLEQAKKSGELPYAVMTVIRVLGDGVTTVLSYEMPPPLFVTGSYAQALPFRRTPIGNALIGEATCHLEPSEGILAVSDGVTQAGLGKGLKNGWTLEGLREFVQEHLRGTLPAAGLPALVLRQAHKVWQDCPVDDCSAVLATCRTGRIVNILTGPPADRSKTAEIVRRFLNAAGTKVVCGGTTSDIVAAALGTRVVVESRPRSLVAPARYHVEGVDLATEGAVTLNQVYNILDEDPKRFVEDNSVTQLCRLLGAADRVNFIVGAVVNPANHDITFRQKGILTRGNIVPLLAEKLRAAGKLVVVEWH